jgi:hypothetical protein
MTITAEVKRAMALLDFIKNRQQQPSGEQSQQPEPETAKEMYSRQAAQEKTDQKPVQQIPEADKSQAKELGARLDKATQHIQQGAPAQTPAPADSTGSPQPMAQKMMNQDTAAPALSPTSAQSGTRESQQEAPAPSGESQAKAQGQSQDRAQTIARTRPSWER